MSIFRLLLLLAASLGALIACRPDNANPVVASASPSTSSTSKAKPKSPTDALRDEIGDALEDVGEKFDELSEQLRELDEKLAAHTKRYERDLRAGQAWGDRVDRDFNVEQEKRRGLERKLAIERKRADDAERRTEQFLIEMAGPKADAVFDKIRLNQADR